jgi:uncharacterized protein YggE
MPFPHHGYMNPADLRPYDRSDYSAEYHPTEHERGGSSRPRATAVAVTATRRADWRTDSRLFVIAALVLVVVFNSLLAARGQATVPSATQGVVSVAGTGVAYGAPDMAVLEVGVSVFGADVRSALSEADASMSAVRDAILAVGIAAEDIRTTSLNVWRDERTNPEGEIVIDRYQVSHSYQVQVRDVDTVGEVLAAAVDAGANSIGGISFTIADQEALATQARALAMADARAKAEQLAELAGVSLGAVTAISEPSLVQGMPYPMGARFEMAALSSVEGGQLAVSITITVSYAID